MVKIKNNIRKTQFLPIRIKRATQRKVQVEVQYLPHYFKYKANIFLIGPNGQCCQTAKHLFQHNTLF